MLVFSSLNDSRRCFFGQLSLCIFCQKRGVWTFFSSQHVWSITRVKKWWISFTFWVNYSFNLKWTLLSVMVKRQLGPAQVGFGMFWLSRRLFPVSQSSFKNSTRRKKRTSFKRRASKKGTDVSRSDSCPVPPFKWCHSVFWGPFFP